MRTSSSRGGCLRRAILILAALALASFALWWLLIGRQIRRETSITHPATLDEAVPPRAQAMMRAATVVEAVLTQNHMSADRFPDSVICGYRIRSTPVRLSEAQRSDLVFLLLDRLGYQNETPPGLFMPDIAYRFLTPAETLDVLVNHENAGVMFVDTESTGSGGTAIPVHGPLLALSRAVFPRDSVLLAHAQRAAREDLNRVERAR